MSPPDILSPRFTLILTFHFFSVSKALTAEPLEINAPDVSSIALSGL